MMLLITSRVSLSLGMVLPLTLRDKKGLMSMQSPYVELAGGSDSRITRQDVNSELDFRGKSAHLLGSFCNI